MVAAGGGYMRLRSKLFVFLAALVVPVATLATVSTVAIQPAEAAANLLYCTGMSGVVNFKQTAAPASPNGLTQLGYYETTSAKAQTTVTGVTGGACHAGTSTSGASLGSGSVTPLPAIKTNPCRVLAAGVAPIVECTQPVTGNFNISSGSKTATVSTALTSTAWGEIKTQLNLAITGTGIPANTKYTATSGTGAVGSTVTLSNAATATVSGDSLTLTTAVPLCKAASAGICPGNETGNFWYGSGWQFANVGVASLKASVPTVTFTVASHTLVFHTKSATQVISTSGEAGFQLTGYTVDTTNGHYSDGSATCTTACPSKIVTLLNTDTGTHFTGNTGAKFLVDISQIIGYTSQPPGTSASRAVKILTVNFDNGIQTSSTSTLVHSYFQS
jgi:hypothetical protein